MQLPVINTEGRFNMYISPDSKVHEAIMGPIWGRQDPGGPHGGAMNFATWVVLPVKEFPSIMKIRRSHDRLIFIKGISILPWHTAFTQYTCKLGVRI